MIQFTHPYTTTGKTIALGWPKTLFQFFCTMAWKNLNKHFDQVPKVTLLFFQGSSVLIFMTAVTICNNFRVQENKSLSLGSLCRKKCTWDNCRILSDLQCFTVSQSVFYIFSVLKDDWGDTTYYISEVCPV